VSRTDRGLNKPFDRIVKDLAEEAPRLFLHLLGIAPQDAAITLAPLRPETAPPVALPDYVAELQVGNGEPIICHVEFYIPYHNGIPAMMARYGGSLAWQYKLQVESVLLLLRPDGMPQDIPAFGEYVIGRTKIIHPFRTVRIWELDPTPVLESNNPRLFPWAILMKSTEEQVRAMGTAVGHLKDDVALGRFLTLGSVRYVDTRKRSI
jgi:hypothetical protein